jgi:hypothetical protein
MAYVQLHDRFHLQQVSFECLFLRLLGHGLQQLEFAACLQGTEHFAGGGGYTP